MGAVGSIRNNWLRWAGVAGVVLVSCSLVIYPMLPDRDAQSLEVVIERLVPGSDEISSGGGPMLTKDEVAVLHSLDLRGELHSGIDSYSGGGEKHARALIVIRGPCHLKPRSGNRKLRTWSTCRTVVRGGCIQAMPPR